ncbi:MAG: metal ABC transporter substrate-binding protein [Candidatus Omnitrophica bacterium]|nr:metal ABC transporter substrate-binding protein [Candidatus Omnitrophota bacterium]MBU4488511.1 metal ABC transporter substrate-binding protein [Candidatus Omnitrophota bacterium]MCG2704577.1 metal ABC transporter substrate-binding protein [Candidatus Omnitrophota bacterium]
MRKLFFMLILLLGLASAAHADDKIRILTTTSDLKSIAEYIGGNKVEVDSLAKGYQDPHFVEAKPSFMLKAKKADLFIRAGLELEIGYEELIIDGSRNPKIRFGQPGHLDASEGVYLLEVPTTTKVDRSMGDVHPMGNPHYWLDPLNVKIVASNIANRLSELSPENESYFKKNLAEFNKKMDEKMVEWQEKLKPFKGQQIAIYHRSWPYFADRFGLKIGCELEPKPGIPPSPGHLKEVIEIIKERNINAILMEVFYDEKPAKFVSQQTGAKVVIVPNSVGGTKEAKDYFSLIDIIVEDLTGALKG